MSFFSDIGDGLNSLFSNNYNKENDNLEEIVLESMGKKFSSNDGALILSSFNNINKNAKELSKKQESDIGFSINDVVNKPKKLIEKILNKIKKSDSKLGDSNAKYNSIPENPEFKKLEQKDYFTNINSDNKNNIIVKSRDDD